MRFSIICILVVHTFGSIAQNKTLIDSLHLELEAQISDSVRTYLYYELNREWAEYSFDSAMNYARQGIDLSNKLKKPLKMENWKSFQL